VVPQKRTIIAAVSTLAATFALAGCGSTDFGLGSNDTQAGGGAAANELGAGGSSTGEKAATKPTAKKPAALTAAGDLTDELIATKVPKMGNVVTDSKGWVLYRFDKDTSKPPKSNCSGDCAKVWPAVLAGEALKVVGVSSDQVSTVRRADGGRQITVNGWPVYRYIGDKKPGQWHGQNVGGVWFVIDKNGKKNLTCVPPVSKGVKAPAEKKPASTETDDTTSEQAAVNGSSY
jgi:predicted lipoprotein with Yx(FWY)xxD motif